MKEDTIKKLIEVEEDRKKELETNLEKLLIRYKTYGNSSNYNNIHAILEHIRECESKIISYSLGNFFKHPTKLQIAMRECIPGELYNLYYSESREVEKNIITEEELINKCDGYLDTYCGTKGMTKKLRDFGNHSTIQLTKIYCDAYHQALKDNNLLK